MWFRLFLILNLISAQSALAQNSFFVKSDSLNIKRIIPVSIGIGGVWGGSMVGLSQIWYKNIDKSQFHYFNDCENWLQMDKFGHVYSNYKISMLSSDLLKWSGVNFKKAAFIGTGIGLSYQTTLELFDGYSSDWGFSWCDMSANALGAGIFLGQELLWREQHILMKFSYHPTEFAQLRPTILGTNFQERLLKDYNGQTYWFSFNPFLFVNNTSFPKWVCFSFGYSVNQKLVGDAEFYIDPNSPSSGVYNSQREWLLSMDIDFSRIEVKKEWLKTILKQFNYLKIPFPALILKNNQLIGVPIYF